MGVIWAKLTVGGTVGGACRERAPSECRQRDQEMHALNGAEKWIEPYEAAHVYLGEHPNVTVAAIRGGMPWRLARNPFECRLDLDIARCRAAAEEVKRSSLHSAQGIRRRARQARTRARDFRERSADGYRRERSDHARQCDAHRRVTGKDSPFIIRRTGADSTHLNRYE